MTWQLDGARKDGQSVTPAWSPHDQQLIGGVSVREIANVPKQNGWLTEIFRREWNDGKPFEIDQIFQTILNASAISAWHAHEITTDRLFVSFGMMRIVLFDAREGSPTHGRINEFRFGSVRPALIIVPPRVWHGVQNISAEPSVLLNIVDRAYDYAAPDHWRVPPDDPSIPFQF